jgi:hypothetical protein
MRVQVNAEKDKEEASEEEKAEEEEEAEEDNEFGLEDHTLTPTQGNTSLIQP